MAEHTFGFRTRALHAGGTPDAEHGARAVPIYQTTSFVFKDTDDAANLFSLQKYGNVYSRLSNPTVAALEERIASLEGGIGAVATASGMAAEFITFAALCQAGDHIVASSQLYGGTVTQLDVSLRRFGIETTFVEGTDPADYKAALTENTKAIYTEVVANPSGEIADLEGLVAVAHEAGIPLVVDATISTPYLIRPLEHGADIVIHSAPFDCIHEYVYEVGEPLYRHRRKLCIPQQDRLGAASSVSRGPVINRHKRHNATRTWRIRGPWHSIGLSTSVPRPWRIIRLR